MGQNSNGRREGTNLIIRKRQARKYMAMAIEWMTN
jgi:hypothetical protein